MITAMRLTQSEEIPVPDVPTTPDEAVILLDSWTPDTVTGTDLLIAAAIIIGGLVLGSLTRRATIRLLRQIDHAPPSAVHIVSRLLGYSMNVLAIVVALEVLGFSFGPALALLVLITVIALVLARPLLQSLGASLVLQIRQPFAIDDQVELMGITGTVHEFNGRAVVLDTMDGRRVHIPAIDVMSGPIINLTAHDRRRTSFDVGVAYDSDLDRAVEIVRVALSNAPGVMDQPRPEAYVHELDDSTINIRARFWHPPRLVDEWGARDEAIRSVKAALDGAGIEIAFPQRVLWTGG